MDSNEKNERQLYIEKLEKQQEVIDQILSLDLGSVLSLEARAELEKLRKKAKSYTKKLKNNEYEVAIVGMEKAGKSTFANALMELDFFPTGDERCTYTSTKIEYNDEDREDYAKVSFYTTETFDDSFRKNLKKLGIENSDKFSYKTLSLEQYKRLYEKDASQEKKDLFGNNINKDIEVILKNQDTIKKLLDGNRLEISADERGINELKEFITDPKKAYAVEEVVIKSKKLEKMKNAVIYDVPGFNSPTELHKIQTKNRMEKADAIIMVADGKSPSITCEPLKILKESDKEGNPLSDKLFVFANRIGMATDIDKNIKVTYEEWITNNKFIPPTNKHRIIFGSALAHIVKRKSPEDYEKENEFKKLEKLEHGDGIDAIREALIEYNKNERFDVLKREINKLEASIRNIIIPLNEEYNQYSADDKYNKDQLNAITLFLDQSRDCIENELKECRNQILKKYEKELPLTHKIREYISKNITKDKYSIDDKLVEKIKLDSQYAGDQDVSKIEAGCRKARFNKMYNKDFSRDVLSIADDFHKECSEMIIEAIMTGMGVDKNSSNYEEIKDLLKKELVSFRKEFASNDNKNENLNMYESLIQRFTRDIYELLIGTDYTPERFERFIKLIDNCLSLSIFYKKDKDNNKYTYLNVTPQDQPLWKMILFHHYLTRDKDLDKLKKDLASVTGLNDDFTDLRNSRSSLDEPNNAKKDSELELAIEKTLDSCCGNTEIIVEDIKKGFNNVKEAQGFEFRVNLLKQLLQKKIRKNEPCNLSDEDNFRTFYNEYHNNSRQRKALSEEYVRKEFDNDINILQEILMNGSVNAINIEKPFVARETRTIDSIREYVKKDGKFRNFLTSNFDIIKYEENKELIAKNAERERNVGIAKAIDSCLDKLN